MPGKATIDNRAVPILEHWERIAHAQKLLASASREQALAMLKQTIAEMKRLYGTFSVPFGDVQTLTHGKTFPVPGHDTLFAVTGPYRNGHWHANHGSSWLLLVEFSTPLKVFTVAPVAVIMATRSYRDGIKTYWERQNEQIVDRRMS